MILLAGILLVIAFIAFSIQLSVLPNLGQQLGRETENPLFEDYLLVKRSFETLLADELRSPTLSTNIVCLDGFDYLLRIQSHLTLLTALEGTRGQSFGWDRLEVERMGGTTTNFEVRITLRLTDGVTTVGEKVTYPVKCNSGTATGCSPACVATPS
jgi:hypothetical protein